MIFPYAKFGVLPVIPVKIKGKELIEFEAFVDSGATLSIFHSSVAEILLALTSGMENK